MGFNLKSILRRASPCVLRQYFDARKINLPSEVDWQDPTQNQPDVLFGAITALAQRDRDAIITDFENVEQLCDAVGQIALHSVASGDARVLSRLQSADTNIAKSITLLLAHDTLFEHALAAAYADRLLRGRSWGAFNIDASATIGFSAPILPAFEAELAAALARPNGSVGKLKIDRFERGAVSKNGKAGGQTVHHAIYSEGLPVSDVEFLGDELKRETRRPVQATGVVHLRNEVPSLR
jgi:hypothetical protein